MKKAAFRPLFSAALAALAACAPASTAEPPFEPDPVLRAHEQMQGDRFALEMFRALAAEEKGNITFSPASLEAVLHLLREGAAGGTRRALEELPLGRQGVQSAMQVQSANALFAADDLTLKAAPADVHRTPFASAPAKAAETINAWCKEKTQGLVPAIASPASITPDTRLVAVNAVYLKERWLRPFDEAATQQEGRFTKADGSTVTVPLMHRVANFRYAEGGDWQAVALFYRRDGRKGEPGCFIGILPKGDAREFAKALTPERYEAIRRSLAAAHLERTSVTLPKMDIDSGAYSLKPALAQQGLAPLFTAAADFSGFCDEPLMLADVLQRCHVIVSEKETEAAAVTMAVLAEGAAPRKKPNSIRFDRPFIWAIGDLTSAAPPYFLGLYEEP